MNNPPLIICVGNPSRGDDAAGPYVAEALQLAAPSLPVIETFQLQPELADDMSAHTVVVIVDAQANAQQPITLRNITAARDVGWCSHALSPEQLLGLFEITCPAPSPQLIAVGIQAHHFELGEAPQPLTQKLSGIVAQALTHLSEEIKMTGVPDVYAFLAQALFQQTDQKASDTVPLSSDLR